MKFHQSEHPMSDAVLEWAEKNNIPVVNKTLISEGPQDGLPVIIEETETTERLASLIELLDFHRNERLKHVKK